MDNNQNKRRKDTSQLEQLLHAPQQQAEIGIDEHAEQSDKFANPRDVELERIIQETLNDDLSQTEEAAAHANEAAQAPTPEETPAAEEKEPEIETEERKVRPKRKKGYGFLGIPHMISVALLLAMLVFIGSNLGMLVWKCCTDIFAFGKKDSTVYISITDNDNIDSITQKLYDAGLIQYRSVFRFFADLTNAEEKISSGTFKLNTLYDYNALVTGMKEKSSYRESIEVVIPEGYTVAQIFRLLEDKGVCTAAKLEAYAIDSQFESYEFMEGAPRGDVRVLEGFLFPDTYEFYLNAKPKEVFIKFLDRFADQLPDDIDTLLENLNTKLSSMMRANGYDQNYIDEHQMKLYDVIKVASMIEKETAHTGENYTVSSVIYNRLTNQRNFPRLEIDATLVYILGKNDLTSEDLKLDDPYNTRVYGGLTPTPISNPGKSAILAALGPQDTDYYYYALNPATGEHKFSKTLAEHNAFLESLK